MKGNVAGTGPIVRFKVQDQTLNPKPTQLARSWALNSTVNTKPSTMIYTELGTLAKTYTFSCFLGIMATKGQQLFRKT